MHVAKQLPALSVQSYHMLIYGSIQHHNISNENEPSDDQAAEVCEMDADDSELPEGD